MVIAYASRTGQVKRFVDKLGMEAVRIDESLVLNDPFVLITYTTAVGEVPEDVSTFLTKNKHNIKGVSASGNKIWGQNFAKSADIISQQYGVPLISKFELSGTQKDITVFRERMNTIEIH